MLKLEMSFRKRDDKYLVTAEFGADELGVRPRICRTVDTEDEAKRLDAKLQHEIYEGWQSSRSIRGRPRGATTWAEARGVCTCRSRSTSRRACASSSLSPCA